MKRLIAALVVIGSFLLIDDTRGPDAASSQEAVTFNNQVIRLLQRRCQSCHHSGDIGPFSLMTYSEARLFAFAMREAAESREMPPWKASADCGEFDGDRRLTDEEVEIFHRWLESDTPEGNPADLPPARQFTDDWELGPPDVVLQPTADFQIELGDDVYRYFSLPTDLRGDRFLSAIDLKPRARSVVHHAILYLDENGESERADSLDSGPGFASSENAAFLARPIGWWAPGEAASFEPSGTAWRLPKGARVVIKIHYHVHHGGSQPDRTQVGLYFARAPVTKELRVLPVVNTQFVIPAGEPKYEITAEHPPLMAGQDVHATGIAAHMQLLGTDLEVRVTDASSPSRCLIKLEEWDSHWQTMYRFKEPVALAAGARITVSAFYNNSTSNSENPNFPPKPVASGERTTDETCAAFVKYTLDAEERQLSSPRITSVVVDSNNRLDVKGRGFLPGSDIEVDGRRVVDTLNLKNKKASKRLRSNNDWRTLIPAGRSVVVTVLNPDGVRSSPLSFSR